MSVSISEDGDKIAVKSPYNDEFIRQAKQLGGFWRNGAWNFLKPAEKPVRDLLIKIYGTDGSPAKMVSIEVDVDDIFNGGSEIIVAGKTVVKKRSRDHAPALNGAFVTTGSFEEYGGSAKYPNITYREGTRLHVSSVPVSVAKQMATEYESLVILDDDTGGDSDPSEFETQLIRCLNELNSDRLSLILDLVDDIRDFTLFRGSD